MLSLNLGARPLIMLPASAFPMTRRAEGVENQRAQSCILMQTKPLGIPRHGGRDSGTMPAGIPK